MKTMEIGAPPWDIRAEEYPLDGDLQSQLKFLVQYAVLAPSIYNSQPWRFLVERNRILIYPDITRWLPIADPDQRELHISIGCALENLLIAAEYFGFSHQVSYLPEVHEDSAVAEVVFGPYGWPSPFRPLALFHSIPKRITNHHPYDGKQVSEEKMAALRARCVDRDISLFTTTDTLTRRLIEEIVVWSDSLLFADPAFREELGYWIGQGTFGTPWLRAKLSQMAVTHLNAGDKQAKQDSEVLMSSPVFGVILSRHNDHASHVRVGQTFERIYLTATSLGLSLQPMSHVVETPETRWELAKLLHVTDEHPQQPFRLGFGEPEQHRTPRRPLEEVLC